MVTMTEQHEPNEHEKAFLDDIQRRSETFGAWRITPDELLRAYQLGRRNFTGARVRGDTPLVRADLNDSDFADAEILGVNLTAANLRGCNFRSATLKHCDLSNVDLSASDLTNVTAHHVNFQWSNWRDVDATGLDALFCDFEMTDFTGADLPGANLYFCDLRITPSVMRLRRISWQSHDLISAILAHEAGQDETKRLAAGFVLVNREMCWADFEYAVEKLPESIRPLFPWALDVLARWATKHEPFTPYLLAERIEETARAAAESKDAPPAE